MNKFKYFRPRSLDEALDYLEITDNCRIISGGTDLLVEIRARKSLPDFVLDVHELSELREINCNPGNIFIGGALTFAELIKSETVNAALPLLVQAVKHVGSAQIRNQGTIAGNVQTASPAGDGLIALLGLDALVRLVSRQGNRDMLIREFVTGPQKTVKRKDEMILGFEIPIKKWDFGEFFKVGIRNALSISVVNGILQFNFVQEGTFAESRVCLGAVAPTPLRIIEAEDYVNGKKYSEELLREFRAIVHGRISPLTDIRASRDYRRYIAGIMCGRSLKKAAEGGRY